MSREIIQNVENVKVSENEYLVKYTFWRNLRKLIENDVNLNNYYNRISENLSLEMYIDGKVYKYGEKVWYICKSKDMAVIIQSIADNNSTNPEAGGKDFESNGWLTLSMDVNIYDTDILKRMETDIYKFILKHEKEMHPFGQLIDSNINEKFMRTDLSNRNKKRETFQFPYITGFLPTDKEGSIINGFYRQYDNGLLEYDIIYRFGYNGKIYKDGFQYDQILCNNVQFSKSGSDSRYFYNEDSASIFNHKNDNQNNFSVIGDTIQQNRNDFVNVYFAQINFPVSFEDDKYIVMQSNPMSNSMIDGDKNIVKQCQNAITFGKKTSKSITAILITYPDSQWTNVGFNSSNGGLARNSFRCKLIGKTRLKDE